MQFADLTSSKKKPWHAAEEWGDSRALQRAFDDIEDALAAEPVPVPAPSETAAAQVKKRAAIRIPADQQIYRPREQQVREWHQVATFLRVRGHKVSDVPEDAGYSWALAACSDNAARNAARSPLDSLSVQGCGLPLPAAVHDAGDDEEVLAQHGEWEEVLCVEPCTVAPALAAEATAVALSDRDVMTLQAGLPPLDPDQAIFHEAAEIVAVSMWNDVVARLAPLLRSLADAHRARLAAERAAAQAVLDRQRAAADEEAAARAAMDWSLPNNGDRILATALRSQLALERRMARGRAKASAADAAPPLLRIVGPAAPESPTASPGAAPTLREHDDAFVPAAPDDAAAAAPHAFPLRRPASSGAPAWQRWLNLSQQGDERVSMPLMAPQGASPLPPVVGSRPGTMGGQGAKERASTGETRGAKRTWPGMLDASADMAGVPTWQFDMPLSGPLPKCDSLRLESSMTPTHVVELLRQRQDHLPPPAIEGQSQAKSTWLEKYDAATNVATRLPTLRDQQPPGRFDSVQNDSFNRQPLKLPSLNQREITSKALPRH